MTAKRLTILPVLLLWVILESFMITADQKDNSNTTVARQFIIPPNAHQLSLSDRVAGNNPSPLAFNGIQGVNNEVRNAQQVEDQIDQLNQLSQQLRALPQTLAIEQTAKGQQIPLSGRYAQQASRMTPWTGLARPLAADAGYLRNIARNPLTGPNGLTNDVLSDLMFGNLKSLAYSGGITNLNNPVEDSALSPQMIGNSALTESPGKPDLGLPLPPNENMDFNDLPSNDLDSLKGISDLRSRHHSKGKRKKKGSKSDVITKLLLTLLVDKLKDIYEVDKLNRTQTNPDNLDTSTIGKIENTLKERSQPTSNKSHHEDDEKQTRLMSRFDTNLSFPLTISDKLGSRVSLVDSHRNTDSSSIDVDTKNIENIIKGIENSKTTEKENNSRQIKGNNNDPANSPEEISKKMTKALNNDNPSPLIKESGSEFHRVKLEPTTEGELGKSGTIPSISDYHPVIEAEKTTDPPAGIFDVHTDKATVSALPTFSISSILNEEIPGNIKGSGRILNEDALKDLNSESISGFTSSPKSKPLENAFVNDERKATTSVSNGAPEPVSYLEASRVLGAVFNKVRDPLARKSVEVAIKAMLKLMKSDSAYSKKHTVPSVNNSWILRQKVGRLMKTVRQLSEAVNEEAKETSNMKNHHRRSKNRFLKKLASYRHTNDHRKPHHKHHHHIKRTY